MIVIEPFGQENELSNHWGLKHNCEYMITANNNNQRRCCSTHDFRFLKWHVYSFTDEINRLCLNVL